MRDRKQQILDAALSAFLDLGYDATTIAEIRRRSGASTGSIYHFFPGKAEIAEALLSDAVAGWSALSTPPDDPNPARAAITASVRGLLVWGTRNPGLFRFLEEIRKRSGFSALEARLANGQDVAARLYKDWSAAGLVRPLPWPVAYALMLGPAYSYLRMGKAGAGPGDIETLTAAAWAAVALTPPAGSEPVSA